jgi:two-component system chemotaxis response regulator CheB
MKQPATGWNLMTTILLIDDDPATLEVINECLLPHFRTRIATRGGKGIELAQMSPAPDLVLLDLELPDMNGYQVCSALKRDTRTAEIPVIFLSSHTDIANIIRGLELGAVDYVPKPVAPPILLARVRTQLRLRQAQIYLADRNLHLESLVSERTQALEARTLDLQRSQELTIVALGAIAETRDNETGDHIRRTRAYVRALVENLLQQPAQRDRMPLEEWGLLWKCAPLHDIGKVGIPDQILLKPGPLDAEEFEIMKRHTTIGRDALHAAELGVDTLHPFLRIASEIIYSHHERWNGTGYPQGLRGEDIPFAARLMAIADVYDALISKRVYKPALPHGKAVEIIAQGRGKHFDPLVVDCFLVCAETFNAIAAGHSTPALFRPIPHQGKGKFMNEGKIQVMIVDDSALVRQVVAQALAREPGIEVMSTAADPLFAMDKMRRNWPDVIILDIEMTRMHGLSFLRKLMAERPTPVIICSSPTATGSDTLMQALAAGAVSIISRPKFGLKGFLEDATNDIIAAIRAAARTRVALPGQPLPTTHPAASARLPTLQRMTRNSADAILPAGNAAVQRTTDKVIAIGTSTGGTQALEAVLTRLPLTIAGIVIVQHMPEQFTAMFAERLNSLCTIEVREGRNNDRVLPGLALIAPGGRHMLLKRSGAQYYIEVLDGPLVNRHKPSVDVLFRSVARFAGGNAAGVIMTGMGDDGARGLKEMNDAGAATIAQDEASCVVFGMPREAIRLGAADRVLPLQQIPAALIETFNQRS